MSVLSVDPGSREGGAVLKDGRRVLAWWAWTRLERKGGEVWRVRCDLSTDMPVPDIEFPTLGHVGRDIAGVVGQPALVVEGLFVPRSKQGLNIQSHTALAESAGWLMGGLGLGVPVARPLASIWRPAVLCPASTEAKAAERLAVQATRWADWPGDPVARLAPKELGAVAEAGFMCDWWLTCGKAAR